MLVQEAIELLQQQDPTAKLLVYDPVKREYLTLTAIRPIVPPQDPPAAPYETRLKDDLDMPIFDSDLVIYTDESWDDQPSPRTVRATEDILCEEWTTADKHWAWQHGWDLFESDTGELEIQALDDPEGVCKAAGIVCGTVFRGVARDHVAAKCVQRQANAGEPVCRKAIEQLIADHSSDVQRFDLKKTW